MYFFAHSNILVFRKDKTKEITKLLLPCCFCDAIYIISYNDDYKTTILNVLNSICLCSCYNIVNLQCLAWMESQKLIGERYAQVRPFPSNRRASIIQILNKSASLLVGYGFLHSTQPLTHHSVSGYLLIYSSRLPGISGHFAGKLTFRASVC